MTPVEPFTDTWERFSEKQRNVIDRIADRLRLKEADQRRSAALLWHQITDIERAKWRELAVTALRAVHVHGEQITV